jgi:hypothetical protein
VLFQAKDPTLCNIQQELLKPAEVSKQDFLRPLSKDKGVEGEVRGLREGGKRDAGVHIQAQHSETED